MLMLIPLQNFHDAEDVAQEVFITAYRRLNTLRRWDSFVNWLYSITTNLCKQKIRSRSRQPDREFIEDQDQKTIAQSSIDRYNESSILELIRDALDSLPSIHREILSLLYLCGMKVIEMSRYLGLSQRTIARRLNDARSSLKEELLKTIGAKFEEQKLGAGFTLRVTEIIKRIKINPIALKSLPL